MPADNKLTIAMDLTILSGILEGMTPEQRREWFILIKMSEKKKTFHDMARRHRMSNWYLSASVHGKYPMSAKVVKTLEDELGVDMRPFLNPAEATRCRIKTADELIGIAPSQEEL